MSSQRKIALDALIEVGENFGYSNLILQNSFQKNNVLNQEKPFITALFYGVLDRLITLDYVISLYTKQPPVKIKPVTLYSLRIAIFQIMFMDKVPQSAAVNESVKLVKASRENFNTGFVNAVLRNILRNGIKLPEDNSVSALKIRYSCPEWIIEGLIADYGIETAISILEHYLLPPKITLRINTNLTTDEALFEALSRNGIKASSGAVIHSVILDNGVDIKSLDEYKKGLFHAQDIPSQVAIYELGIKAGSTVLDMCAAPGGKSFTAAQYAGENSTVISCDIYNNRVSLIKAGAKRLNLNNIDCRVMDTRLFDSGLGQFDYVLCDVPCSGLGVIRRKPEIKYKTNLDFDELNISQTKIAENGIKYLKPGGKLLYSTCTLRRAENEEIVKSLLSAHPELKLLDQHTFLPQTDNTDGFYYAIIQKSPQ